MIVTCVRSPSGTRIARPVSPALIRAALRAMFTESSRLISGEAAHPESRLLARRAVSPFISGRSYVVPLAKRLTGFAPKPARIRLHYASQAACSPIGTDPGGLTHPGHELAGLERMTQHEPLYHVASQRAQSFQRRLVLDAFGRHREPQVMRELDSRAHDKPVACVAHHSLHQRLVELELVHGQAAQIGERGVAGAVV